MVWLVGVVSRRWVWLVGVGEIYGTLLSVVVRRYIDFIILLIPTPLVSVLFCSSIPTFCSFFRVETVFHKQSFQCIIGTVHLLWFLLPFLYNQVDIPQSNKLNLWLSRQQCH